MNDKLMLIAISGDGNKETGDTTFYIHNKVKDYDTYDKVDITNQNDMNLLNNYIETDLPLKNKKNIILHIDLFKEYIRQTRPKVFNENFLSMFNSHNEKNLFTLFSTMGNVLIQVSEYTTVIYLPERINEKIKEELVELKEYADNDKMISVLQSKNIKENQIYDFNNYDEFINQMIKNKKTK